MTAKVALVAAGTAVASILSFIKLVIVTKGTSEHRTEYPDGHRRCRVLRKPMIDWCCWRSCDGTRRQAWVAASIGKVAHPLSQPVLFHGRTTTTNKYACSSCMIINRRHASGTSKQLVFFRSNYDDCRAAIPQWISLTKPDRESFPNEQSVHYLIEILVLAQLAGCYFLLYISCVHYTCYSCLNNK